MEGISCKSAGGIGVESPLTERGKLLHLKFEQVIPDVIIMPCLLLNRLPEQFEITSRKVVSTFVEFLTGKNLANFNKNKNSRFCVSFFFTGKQVGRGY